MLLVVTYSRDARATLRNLCRGHGASVVRRFGRAALFEGTEHGALLACRLRARHPDDTRVERTVPFNEYADAPDAVREAARAYESEASKHTPYARFAAGTDHPDPERLRERPLDP
ncbi:hypothetical protein [Halosegnis marinus]|uniref:Uncharacterized protein n=1 Tax=Halosegnis marinus TaxID=3034023 RepID=A0ABD5ZPX4_9EURY|nr:hypothetical protein [Halosegnis sp. DT85]